VVANAMLINTDLLITSGQDIIACVAPPISVRNPRGCWEKECCDRQRLNRGRPPTTINQ
jgi:hypothetical protein